MDALDVRILPTMGIQPYGRQPRPLDTLRSARIAKALGASPERVRGRIAGMEGAGLIDGYDIYSDYHHLGLESTWYYYEFPDEDLVDGAMEKLEPLEGVAACCAFVGGLMCVNVT